jgi:hypothetical protein
VGAGVRRPLPVSGRAQQTLWVRNSAPPQPRSPLFLSWQATITPFSNSVLGPQLHVNSVGAMVEKIGRFGELPALKAILPVIEANKGSKGGDEIYSSSVFNQVP